jgi:hypothetical protein
MPILGRLRQVTAIALAALFLGVLPTRPLAAAQAAVDTADGPATTDVKTTAPPAAAGPPAAAPRAIATKPADDFGLPEVALINAAIRQGWQDHELAPSRPATDGEWCRRVYLDLIGRVPTVDELAKYQAEPKRDQRRRLVDRLLGDEYAAEYSRNWTTVWTNLLVGRTGGNDRNSLVSRPGIEQYLRESFGYNRPYDELARELLTATGSVRPGDADFNGAANFLVDKMADGGVLATAQTSQIFLGNAVQCTQCHNHPFNENKQNQFWELNAFFRQTRVERIEEDNRRRVGRVVNRDFAGQGGDANKAEIYFEQRNGQMKVAYPAFIDGTSLAELYQKQGKDADFGNHGKLADVNRREELAKLVLAAREFDRAIVNRMWAHFLGYGFTKPVDDIGPHNTPSHPDLLDRLGAAFRDAGFDMKKLMRWIALCEAYGLSSQVMPRNQDDDPALGARPMFSRFYLRQMQAEQLYESLLVATAAEGTLAAAERQQMKDRWLGQFNTAFGTDDRGESTTFNGTIPQVLALMNGDLMKRATGDDPGSMLARIASDPNRDNAAKINYLYLAALSRTPTRYELAISNELLAARGGNVGPALQDIWWALLNTNEFILNH